MNKKNSKLYDRRFVLKSASACIALPFLNSLAGSRVSATGGLVELASTTSSLASVRAPKSASGIPKRLVFIPMGYGVNSQNWFPSTEQAGRNYELPPLVKPFEDVKSDISFIQQLECPQIPNPHAGSKTFLTCKASVGRDSNFINSVSCDQLAADLLGSETRFDYLAIGRSSGPDGHHGLASHGHDGKPVGVHRTMEDVYAGLFGTGGKAENVRAQLRRERSSLDSLLYEAKKLNGQVSAEDRDRVDEYFTSIRNIERRLLKAQQWAGKPYPKAPFEFSKVKGEAKDDIELIFDMMLMAMQTDSTRVLSYMMQTESVMTEMNPHRMSHANGGDYDPASPSAHQKRDLAFSNLVAGFIRKLKNTKEADGSSLLDHSLIAYGSCLRQGHQVSKGPLILAGHGGGGLKQGQNLIVKETPLENLWLSMLRQVGVKQDKFANSTGVIKELGFV